MYETKFHVHIKREKISIVFICVYVFWCKIGRQKVLNRMVADASRIWGFLNFVVLAVLICWSRFRILWQPLILKYVCLFLHHRSQNFVFWPLDWFWRYVNYYQVILCRISQCNQGRTLKSLLDGCGRNGSRGQPAHWLHRDAVQSCEDPISKQIAAASVGPCDSV
jgi:hypothetical protein